jgi:hypothetical protein
MDPTRKRIVLTAAGVGLVVLLTVVGLAARSKMIASSEPPPPGPEAALVPAAPPVVYDPTKLLDNGVPAAEVYDKEPRTAAWADAAELVVGGSMGRDLGAMVPEAQVVIKCRTLSCLVGIDAPAAKREDALRVTKFLMLAPWVVDLDAEEDGTMRWLFFQEPRFADPQTFVEWFQKLRKNTLASIHAGKSPNPFPVPVEQVPKE